MNSFVATLILLVGVAIAAPMPQAPAENVAAAAGGCVANAMRPNPDKTASPNCLF